jgi:prephenate dehydrogenase
MRTAILGAGRIGSWLAKILSRDHKVVIYDIDEEKTKNIPSILALHKILEIKDYKPELLINAVSLQHTISAFEAVEKYLPKDCIICDVASIKGGVASYYERSKFRFVSVHPMFGPTFADMASFEEENAVIIKESCSEGALFFRSFFTGLGISIFEYSFQEHDRMMAYSLSIPFMLSMVFAGCIDNKAVPGTTFKKHMNIAKGLLSEDNSLLAEVLFNQYTLAEIEKVVSRLELLKHITKGNDYEEAERFFERLRKNIE